MKTHGVRRRRSCRRVQSVSYPDRLRPHGAHDTPSQRTAPLPSVNTSTESPPPSPPLPRPAQGVGVRFGGDSAGRLEVTGEDWSEASKWRRWWYLFVRFVALPVRLFNRLLRRLLGSLSRSRSHSRSRRHRHRHFLSHLRLRLCLRLHRRFALPLHLRTPSVL